MISVAITFDDIFETTLNDRKKKKEKSSKLRWEGHISYTHAHDGSIGFYLSPSYSLLTESHVCPLYVYTVVSMIAHSLTGKGVSHSARWHPLSERDDRFCCSLTLTLDDVYTIYTRTARTDRRINVSLSISAIDDGNTCTRPLCLHCPVRWSFIHSCDPIFSLLCDPWSKVSNICARRPQQCIWCDAIVNTHGGAPWCVHIPKSMVAIKERTIETLVPFIIWMRIIYVRRLRCVATCDCWSILCWTVCIGFSLVE